MQPLTSPFNPEGKLQSAQDFFFTKTAKNSYVRVDSNDLLYVQAAGSSVEIFTSQSKYILSANLNSFCSQFPHPSLLRVHRSYVVNILKVLEIEDNYLILKGNSVPVGRSYREKVAAAFFRLQAD